MSHILVIYASKRGATEEVARVIAGQLHEDGHSVDLHSADVAPAPGGYDAVVVGGSLYIGRWHSDARRYLRRNAGALRTLPLAVFALGPLRLTAKDVADSRAQLDATLAKFPELTPDRVAVFGGAINPDALHFPFNHMAAGDARDWPAIRAWADDLAAVFVRAAVAPRG